MAKFKKKPLEIEAEQFFPSLPPWPEGVEKMIEGYPFDFGIWDSEQSCNVKVNIGDWIITGVKGEKYPCSDEVFRKSYERVN